MKDIKNVNVSEIPFSNIVFAVTSIDDYNMNRAYYVEDWPEYGDYTIVQGSHCSCYGFDETTWDVTVYTHEEIKKVMEGWKTSYSGVEVALSTLYFNRPTY